jgi:hypothetical protein
VVVSAADHLLAATDGLVDGAECWQRAEWHLLTGGFRVRLTELGLNASPEAGLALIAAALFLAEHCDEWDGDARDALAEVATLGRAMVEHGHRDDEPGNR